jgi:hypothetical protein
MRVVRCAVVGALLIAACPLGVSGWQAQQTEPLSNPAADANRRVVVDDSAEVRQAELLRVQRQKQLISDSDKLLKLFVPKTDAMRPAYICLGAVDKQ